MHLDHASREIGGRLFAEFAGDIAKANLAVPIALASPKRAFRRRIGMRDEYLGTGFEVRRRARYRLKGERPADALAFPHARFDGLGFGFEIAPVAAMHAHMDKLAARISVFGVQAKDFLEVRDRLFVAMKFPCQQVPAVYASARAVGLQRDRFVVADERFVIALQTLERDGPILVKIRSVRLELQGAVIARKRFLCALEVEEHAASVVERFRKVGLERQSSLVAGKC